MTNTTSEDLAKQLYTSFKANPLCPVMETHGTYELFPRTLIELAQSMSNSPPGEQATLTLLDTKQWGPGSPVIHIFALKHGSIDTTFALAGFMVSLDCIEWEEVYYVTFDEKSGYYCPIEVLNNEQDNNV